MPDIPYKEEFEKLFQNFKQEKKELDEYRKRLIKSQHQYIAAKNDLKIFEAERKQFARKKRNHRIFTRGAMLETFLLRPELLTDEQVHAILKFAFSNSETNNFLNRTISETIRELSEPDFENSEEENKEREEP